MENLQNRRTRPYNEFRRVVGPELEKYGIRPDQKLSWSQKAGCPCGCSPGFRVEGDYRRAIHVTVSAD